MVMIWSCWWLWQGWWWWLWWPWAKCGHLSGQMLHRHNTSDAQNLKCRGPLFQPTSCMREVEDGLRSVLHNSVHCADRRGQSAAALKPGLSRPALTGQRGSLPAPRLATCSVWVIRMCDRHGRLRAPRLAGCSVWVLAEAEPVTGWWWWWLWQQQHWW